MKNMLIGCGIGCAAIVVLGVLVAGGLGGLGYYLYSRPSLVVSMSMPNEVAFETEAVMSITLTNPHEQAGSLDYIDMSSSFWSGFQVLKVEPEPVLRSESVGKILSYPQGVKTKKSL